MIRQIEEVHFPEYATLHQATINLSAMGDRTITTQIRIDGDIVPEFGVWENDVFYPMELVFKGERFVLPIREPQAMKDNTTRNSLIDLTFYSWPINELKRYFFVEMASTTSGTAIADKYVASLALNLENFVGAFNNVLEYYFGNQIRIDLFMPGTGLYPVEPVFFEINYSYLWDVLTKMSELYNDVRWYIEKDGDQYVIKVGYDEGEILDHDFAYGYEGGLLKFERQVQDDNIVNILLGRGGEKNLPYRYFKRIDENNTEWAQDPDAIAELQNIYFDNLRDQNFRWYVRGWMQNTERDPSWEIAGYRYPTYTEDQCPENCLFAFRRGKTDRKFNPVEYVKNDESIEKYGERWGALDNNEEIYPTIQGVIRPPMGRVDEAVDISDIVTDDITEYAANAAIETSLRDMSLYVDYVAPSYELLSSDAFTIEEGNIGNITYRPMSKDSVYPNLVYYDTTRSYLQAELISTGTSTIVPSTYDESTGNFVIAGLPAGTYRLRLNMALRIDNPATVPNGTFGLENIVLSTSAVDTNAWKPTFDIWVKNIWETTQGIDESDADYSTRVWTPILGDRVGNEAKIVFSTGAMSISQDYEFTIASYPVVDKSKSINGVPSEWKITVYKSDAEFQATGLYIPNAQSAKPVAGDKFFFIGIDMPFIYVEWAEQRLREYKETELGKIADLNPSWVITLDKVRVHTLEDSDYEDLLADRLTPGVKVRITDPRFTHGDILRLYVQSMTYTWNEPSDKSPYLVPDIEVVLSDKVISRESPIAQLQSDVDVISQAYVQTSDVEAVVRKIAGSLYLKKTGERDTSSSPTSFSSKVTSTNFRKGGIGGRGWGIYQDNSQVFAASEADQAPAQTRRLSRGLIRAGDTPSPSVQIDTKSVMEVDKLIVRDEMQVNSLVVNQIAYRGGKEIISAANIEVTQVIETTDSFVCYFDQKQGSVANLFEVNDIAYGQVWTAENNELRYYKMLVTNKDINSITLSKTVKDGAGTPKVGDIIVQYGNISDLSRQYVIVRDVIGGGYERMLSGLNSVTATGEEYYFAGTQVSENTEFISLYEGEDLGLEDTDSKLLGYLRQKHSPRWFVGDALGQYAEWKDGVLNINGILAVTTQLAKADGTYYSLSSYLNDIEEQLGGDFLVWYEDGTPTLANYPANTWDTVEVKNSHINDLYFDNETGNCYRFTYTDPVQEGQAGTYGWTQISRAEFDEEVANNLRASIGGLQYLKEATNRGTLVQGGLVLTSLIQLGKTENQQFSVWAGINGLRDLNERGGGIAAWFGGPMVDHEASPSTQSYAESLFRFDGTGYLAGGNITWNADGSGQVAGGALSWDSRGIPTIAGSLTISGSGDTALIDLLNRIDAVDWFVDETYTENGTTRHRLKLNTKYVGMYADGYVSAGGLSTTSGGGGGGGGAEYLRELEDVSDSLNPQTGEVLYFDGSVWTSHNFEIGDLDHWSGSTNINTLGTIVTGIWNGTPISNGSLEHSELTLWGQSVNLGDTVTGDISSIGKMTFTPQSSISDSGNVLEVVNIGTTENPSYALHSVLPIYSDSFISAGGVSTTAGGVVRVLDDLDDVSASSPSFGDYLMYDGVSWSPHAISSQGAKNVFYGTCGTASGTAAKIVICDDFTAEDLLVGTIIYVYMSYSEDVATSRATLTIKQNSGSTGYNSGAITIYSLGGYISWKQYETVGFIYNGAGWSALPTYGFIANHPSVTRASTSSYGGILLWTAPSTPSSTTLSTTGTNYRVQMTSSGQLYVNVPSSGGGGGGGGSTVSASASYTASDGGPSIGSITIDGTTTTYYAPKATRTRSGTVKAAAVRTSTSLSLITGGTTSGRYYGVEMDGNGQLFVNVPWVEGSSPSGSYLPLSGGTMTGRIESQDIWPKTTNAYDLGSDSKYFRDAYVNKVYLASGVYLEYDSTNLCVYVRGAGIATDSFVSAGGVSNSVLPTSLDDLTDVSVGLASTEGQLLGYNANTNLWEPLLYGTPNNQDVLVYDSTRKKWVPMNINDLLSLS